MPTPQEHFFTRLGLGSPEQLGLILAALRAGPGRLQRSPATETPGLYEEWRELVNRLGEGTAGVLRGLGWGGRPLLGPGLGLPAMWPPWLALGVGLAFDTCPTSAKGPIPCPSQPIFCALPISKALMDPKRTRAGAEGEKHGPSDPLPFQTSVWGRKTGLEQSLWWQCQGRGFHLGSCRLRAGLHSGQSRLLRTVSR